MQRRLPQHPAPADGALADAAPLRGLLFHFTHVDNLASIVRDGLLCDTTARAGPMQTEIGNQGIKLARRSRVVPIAPGGVVADYVPFYFAPRSPMLYVIHNGQVPTYQHGQAPIVYLVVDADDVRAGGHRFVFTDRNASLGYARFEHDLARLDDTVDWDLMGATYWNDTPTEPDRKERRMAELLVHQRVPWSLVRGVGVIDTARQSSCEQILTTLGQRTPVRIRPGWYF